jgi:hypothetical protein
MIVELLAMAITIEIPEQCPSSIPDYASTAFTAVQTQDVSEHLARLTEEIASLNFEGEVPENSWEFFLWKERSEENRRTACLFRLVAQEQYLRFWYIAAQTRNRDAIASQPQLIAAGQILRSIDQRNRNWLDNEFDQNGWFTISEYGEDADVAAFLIVQHADHDVQFQIEMLEQLEPLAQSGDTNSGRYAMLVDRVSVNTGELQVYGSQGYCSSAAVWQARPYKGTLDEMNQRRRSVGLSDHQAYVAYISRNCSSREN